MVLSISVSFPIGLSVSPWYMGEWANIVVQRCVEHGIYKRFEEVFNHTRQLGFVTSKEWTYPLNDSYWPATTPPCHQGVINDYVFLFYLYLALIALAILCFFGELLVDFLRKNRTPLMQRITERQD